PCQPSLLTVDVVDMLPWTASFIVCDDESGMTTILTYRNAEGFLCFLGLPCLGSTFAITKTLLWFWLPLPRLVVSSVFSSEYDLKNASSSSTTPFRSYLSSRMPMTKRSLCIINHIGSYLLWPNCLCISTADIPFFVM